MNAFHRAASFALAGALFAACAGQTAATNPPTSSNAPAAHAAAGSLQFRVFTAGQSPGFPAGAGAYGIAAGPNETIWFTDGGTPAIGRIASDGTITEFSSGLQVDAEPLDIKPGPDGNMWFSDFKGLTIGKITPSGTITEYKAAKLNDDGAKGLAFDAQGRPWVVGYGIPAVLAHLTPNGKVDVRPLPQGFNADGTLVADAAGNLWFSGKGNREHLELLERVASTKMIVRVHIPEVSARLPCCPNAAANPITIGPNGEPWLTALYYLEHGTRSFHLATVQNGQSQLLKLTHKGLSSSAHPSGIASNGSAIWVTGGNPLQNKGALWRFASEQNQTAYQLPYDPISLTVDASGNPWFTAGFGGSASQIVEVLGTGSR
ncbi:MAG TPA: hypothetical protein VGF18_07525 [Candidatus Tumulicola sp.]|jgi:virginiamycin B lyase